VTSKITNTKAVYVLCDRGDKFGENNVMLSF
jgi:hypothetical protein